VKSKAKVKVEKFDKHVRSKRKDKEFLSQNILMTQLKVLK